MKYFKNIVSLEDLKTQYKKLAKKNHPDVGGDLEAMAVKQISSKKKKKQLRASQDGFILRTDGREADTTQIYHVKKLVNC